MSWVATAFAKGTRGHPTITTKAVLMVLADYHNEEMGYAWASQQRIAEDCEITDRSVRSALTTLERLGFITRTQAGNQYQPSHYVFNFSCTQARAPEATISGAADAQAHAPENIGIQHPESAPEDVSGAPKVDRNSASASSQVHRKSSVSAPEAPRHSNPQEPPVLSLSLQTTIHDLQRERGFASAREADELVAAQQMLDDGYSPEDIVGCYRAMKQDPVDKYWRNKPLWLGSVYRQIGEWMAQQTRPSAVEEDRGKYLRDYQRRHGDGSPAAAGPARSSGPTGKSQPATAHPARNL